MKDILIVEDGTQERERLAKLFAGAGYVVEACSTVGEAEKLMKHGGFRVAILDIGLSDKSGSHLFNTIQKGGNVSYIIIFTGNPSVHLKQRFLDEGAVDYIVKASPQAQNESFLTRVRELIGTSSSTTSSTVEPGIALDDFLRSYVDEKSRQLFLDMDNSFSACKECGSREYRVTFSHTLQVPPEIKGQVICCQCSKLMDSEVG